VYVMLAYRVMVTVASRLALLARSSSSKDAEILAQLCPPEWCTTGPVTGVA